MAFQLYQQLCWEAMVSLGLVSKCMITIFLRRSERKLFRGRRRDSSDIAVTVSQGGPKGLGSPSK